MNRSTFLRIAIDDMLTFIVTFGVFWFLIPKPVRPTDTATVVGIIVIWVVGAVVGAVLSDRLRMKGH